MALTVDSALKLSAEQLLAIKNYHKLFVRGEKEVKHMCHRLLMKWHTDHCTHIAAEEVTSHILSLKEDALTALKTNSWGIGEILHFETKSTRIELRHFGKIVLDGFGDHYVGRFHATTVTEAEMQDLVNTAVNAFVRIEAVLKADPKLEINFMPQRFAEPKPFALTNGQILVRMEKTSDFLNLRHILARGPIHPKHVVWIISRLLGLACLCETADTPNLHIDVDVTYVNPKTHEVILMDGWQYAAHFGKKAVAAPRSTLKLCPGLAVTGIPQIQHMIVMIKALAMRAFGDKTGLTLHKLIPKPLADWANDPPLRTAIEEFTHWDKVKAAAYGKPAFHELNLCEADIYE